MYLALYDAERQRINYPYYVDTVDTDLPDPKAWYPFGEGQARGITAYAIRLDEPLLIDTEAHEELVRQGEIELLGDVRSGILARCPVARRWPDHRATGRPDLRGGRALHGGRQGAPDFVAQHIGSALSRARAIEETRERNAELAVINEIGEALAKQLDFEAIISLVGDRVRSIFSARGMFIALYHPKTETLTFPYDIDEGESFDRGTMPFGPGITSTVIRTGKPLRLVDV